MAEETQQQTHQSSSVNGWLVAVLLVLVAFLYLQMSGRLRFGGLGGTPRAITARGDLAEDEKSQIELFRHASPTVVHVTSAAIVQDRIRLNLLELPKGSGSGFIWDTSGHVVTNYHVVKGAGVFRVILSDNSSWDARLVGHNADNDLAVLKIDAPPGQLRPIPVGTSADLQVGQKVLAIGNPFSLDQTLTTGVISGLGREIESQSEEIISDVIQTDAAINPGNSGGPLLDSAGRLIGINTAIFSPSGAYAGIGFAVPVDTINRIVPQLIQSGRVFRPGLGIVFAPDSYVVRLRQAGLLSQPGVLVRGIFPNSAATRAGIQPTHRLPDGRFVLGDLIVSIDGNAVENSLALFKILENYDINDQVILTVIRGNKQVELELTLQPLPTNR